MNIKSIALLALISSLPLHAGTVTTLYEITSGTFVECCGYFGPTYAEELPGEYGGAMIELTLDDNNAAMAILDSSGELMQLGPYSLPAYLEDGVVSGNSIRFLDTRGDFALEVYGEQLTMEGAFDLGICCDLPTTWTYYDVHATLIPEPTTLSLLAIGIGAALMRRRKAAM